jgi:hypothetical protein
MMHHAEANPKSESGVTVPSYTKNLIRTVYQWLSTSIAILRIMASPSEIVVSVDSSKGNHGISTGVREVESEDCFVNESLFNHVTEGR